MRPLSSWILVRLSHDRNSCIVFFFLLLLFFSSTKKFPGQRSNLCHSSGPGPCSDYTRFLICSATGELWFFIFLFSLFFFMPAPIAFVSSWAGVKLELQLQAYTIATAMLDPNHIFNLCHSLWQCQILNPLSEARD